MTAKDRTAMENEIEIPEATLRRWRDGDLKHILQIERPVDVFPLSKMKTAAQLLALLFTPMSAYYTQKLLPEDEGHEQLEGGEGEERVDEEKQEDEDSEDQDKGGGKEDEDDDTSDCTEVEVRKEPPDEQTHQHQSGQRQSRGAFSRSISFQPPSGGKQPQKRIRGSLLPRSERGSAVCNSIALPPEPFTCSLPNQALPNQAFFFSASKTVSKEALIHSRAQEESEVGNA
jgi:hypothetical protein